MGFRAERDIFQVDTTQPLADASPSGAEHERPGCRYQGPQCLDDATENVELRVLSPTHMFLALLRLVGSQGLAGQCVGALRWHSHLGGHAHEARFIQLTAAELLDESSHPTLLLEHDAP
ncbi:hypothetical protein Q664_04625 [Archangium violaceum Cb vi76]|uniref:Uncharacterized protein n=1 Tax=Archangium violaceum Cb vi76 TaxID=1406225 RepID=A0A084T0H3_9BACT|nr:hypothetical protein Q664_04625 [Archangium violaceum Cb vi76]